MEPFQAAGFQASTVKQLLSSGRNTYTSQVMQQVMDNLSSVLEGEASINFLEAAGANYEVMLFFLFLFCLNYRQSQTLQNSFESNFIY